MKVLRRGDSGDDVFLLKDLLAKQSKPDLNFSNREFDYYTDICVCDFQRRNGLEVDGVVGPKTWQMLEEAKTIGVTIAEKRNPIAALCSVPYYSQRDNENKPNSTCNATSLAMVLSFYGEKPKKGQLEDELYEQLYSPEGTKFFNSFFSEDIKRKYNPHNLHEMLDWAAKQRGYSARTSYTAKDAEVHSYIMSGKPVIISGRFTSSGHIVVVVGMTASGDFIIHDPYGDWRTGYRSAIGSFVVYPFNKLATIWKDKPDVRLVHYIEPKR